MIDMFECCGEIASIGIIVDFTEDTETYIVGSPLDIKAWAYGGCPRKAPKGLMQHSNKLGNLVKDINRLMKVKRELNEIMELSTDYALQTLYVTEAVIPSLKSCRSITICPNMPIS